MAYIELKPEVVADLSEPRRLVACWVAWAKEVKGSVQAGLNVLNVKAGTNYRTNVVYEWRKGRYDPSAKIATIMLMDLLA